MTRKEDLLEDRLATWQEKYTQKVVARANKIGVHMNALIEAYSRIGFNQANDLLEPAKNLEEYIIMVKLAERRLRHRPDECPVCQEELIKSR